MKGFLVLLSLIGAAIAQDFPDAPRRVIDKPFVAMSAAVITITLLDSYTTSQIHGRWQSTPSTQYRPCMEEAASPWLYGRHPGPLAAYSVGAGKIAVAESIGYLLKSRHNRFAHKLWPTPFVYFSLAVPAVVKNFQDCF